LGTTLRTSASILVMDRSRVEFSRVLALDPFENIIGSGVLLGEGSEGVITNSVFRRCSNPGALNGVAAIGVGVIGGPTEELSVATIDSCVFENNIVPEFGVVRFYGGAGVVTRSVFLGNRRLEGFGFGGGSKGVAIGAIFNQFSVIPPFLSVTDNLFVGNSTADDLGADSVPIVATAIRQGTIARNTFAENTTEGETISLFNAASNNTTVANNLIAGESPLLDPLFLRNPDDGGDGFGDDPATHDIDESLNDDYGDLRLRAGSPAIDAGDVFFDFDTILDLSGNDRYVDDPGIPGAFIDLGAYEFQGTTCLPDVNGDGIVNPGDFNAWVIAFNNGSPLADQNRDDEVSPDDFNAWVFNYNTGCP
ncbi:MAG: GC-type dockerin domain-anchored protein, partial [Bacteroidota bacterium]